jgi:hypothetical protein
VVCCYQRAIKRVYITRYWMEDEDKLIVEQKLVFYIFLRTGRKEKLEAIHIFNVLPISL